MENKDPFCTLNITNPRKIIFTNLTLPSRNTQALSTVFCFLLFCFVLKRQSYTEIKNKRQTSWPSIYQVTPQELHPGLPQGCQGSKQLEHFTLFSQATNKELDQKFNSQDTNQHPHVSQCTGGSFTHYSTPLTLIEFLLF